MAKLVFDHKDFAYRLANNHQLMSMVAMAFQKEMSGLVEQLKYCVDQKDWSKTIRLAHRIKGACSEVSGYAMSEDAREIEFATINEHYGSISAYFQLLERHYHELLAALDAYFPS